MEKKNCDLFNEIRFESNVRSIGNEFVLYSRKYKNIKIGRSCRYYNSRIVYILNVKIPIKRRRNRIYCIQVFYTCFMNSSSKG